MIMKKSQSVSSWKLVVVSVVTIAVTGYAVWTTQSLQRERREQVAGRINASQENKNFAAAFQTTLFAEFSEREDLSDAQQVIEFIESTLEGAQVHNNALLDEPSVRGMIRTASEFLYYRFLRDDPRAYIAWRLERGDRFRDRETMFVQYQVAYDYEELFGEPFPEESLVQDMFVRFYEHQRSLWGEHHTPVGYGVDPASVLMITAVQDPVMGAGGVDLGDSELNRLWFGEKSSSHRSWFAGAVDMRTVNTNQQKYQVGTVGFVIEYKDGERRVVTLPMVRPIDGGRWSVEYLGTVMSEHSGGLIEF